MHLSKWEQTVVWIGEIERNSVWKKFLISQIIKCIISVQNHWALTMCQIRGWACTSTASSSLPEGMNLAGAMSSPCFLGNHLCSLLWWWQRCWFGLLSLWGQQLHCELVFMFSHKTLQCWSLSKNFIFLFNNWSLLCAMDVLATLKNTNMVELGPCLYRVYSLLVQWLERCEQKWSLIVPNWNLWLTIPFVGYF